MQRVGSRSTAESTTLRHSDVHSNNHWSQWSGRRHYSLEVVQHPIRARMCGFGDKDRRPLAPAVVAKMVVRKEDNSIVDADEVDCSFFLVTVDLWSADSKREMNLVLHPSSTADRCVPVGANKSKRPRGSNPTVPSPRSEQPSPPSSHSTPSSATEPSRISMDQQVVNPMMASATTPGYHNPNYPYVTAGASLSDSVNYSGSSSFTSSPDSPSGWSYTSAPGSGQVDRSNIHNPTMLRGAPRNGIPTVTAGESWHAQPSFRTENDATNFRGWSAPADPPYSPVTHTQASIYGGQEAESSARPHPLAPLDMGKLHAWSRFYVPSDQLPGQGRYSQDQYGVSGHGYDNSAVYSSPIHPQQSPQATYYQHHYAQSTSSSPPSSAHPLSRHSYTRTLVGPLSSNACRLLDEHRRPGIFFLFQDLSVRTEGTFRLRLRLMNVGDSTTPGSGALRVHTNVSPVLAQAFTEPFIVYSAKRFPGVPDTTPLSIAFGNQGQKLPLRNRHGTAAQGRRAHREGESEGSDDTDDI
ncbi:velvet factor-domain-containing protein [Scleroderma citrinum]